VLLRQQVEYLTLLTNQSEIITFNQTCKSCHFKTTLRLDMLTIFHHKLSPQQRGSKSACLCTSFQNLRTSQLHTRSRNHTWQQLQSCNCVDWKGKGKVHLMKGHEGPEEEQRCSCTLSVTSMVDGSGWLAPRLESFIRGTKTRYSGYRCLGWRQGLSGRVRKILPPPAFDLRTVQPMSSLNTD
jgi:hypothetical protein